MKNSVSGMWNSRELQSVKSAADFVSSLLSGGDKLQLAQMISSADKPVASTLSSMENDIHELRRQLSEEQKISAKLRAAMSAMDNDHAEEVALLKKTGEEELLKVEREKYALSAQLSVLQSDTDKRLQTLAAIKESDVAGHEQLAQLEEDIRQQDMILRGYEKDNAQLRSEMKQLRAVNKANEERMFHDNHKLKTELANLREELQSYKDARLTYQHSDQSSAVLGAGRIAVLESELRDAKTREKTSEQHAQQSNAELQREVDALRTRVRDLEAELSSLQNEHSLRVWSVSEEHEKEMQVLRKKLKWYTENQQLLDKDAALLSEKDVKIAELTDKLRQLRTDAGQKQLHAKASQNERISQAKRIQDLERQVKEMENIVRKRHPNSLPAVIWAAASADAATKTPSVEYLEGRIHKLETDLDLKDEEAKKSIRALEQKYNAMKLSYEERIQDLEARNSQLHGEVAESNSRPHSTQLSVQRELDSVKERHRHQVSDLQQTIAGLRQQLLKLPATAKAPRMLFHFVCYTAQSLLGLSVRDVCIKLPKY